MEKLYPIATATAATATATASQPTYGASPSPAGVEGLVRSLQAMGCEVTGGDAFLKLKRRPFHRRASLPESLLTLTAEELQKDVEEYAVAEIGSSASDSRRRLQDQLLDQEMAEIMSQEADAYLDVLRPKFDAAAAEARAVVAYGIQPNDNAEAVISRGGKAAEQWISFKSGSKSVRVLARIAAIRYSLAEVTGAGEGPDADHGVGITRPFIPQATELASRGEQPHVKWLRIAPNLDLVPFADLSPDDQLTAGGYDVDELRAQARRQLRRADDAATQQPKE